MKTRAHHFLPLKISATVGGIVGCLAVSALAADTQQLVDTARVFSAVPVYSVVKDVTPHEYCWAEQVAEERYLPNNNRRNDVAPVVAGGIIGGVVGHVVSGNSHHKKLGTVVGGVLGAAVGHSVAQHNNRNSAQQGYTQVNYRDVERCRTTQEVNTRRVLQGYDVTYEYLGNKYTTRMPNEPGNTLRIAVQITPLAY